MSILDNRKVPAYAGTSIEARGQEETVLEQRSREDIPEVVSRWAVSYTHLDVYKRQTIDIAMIWTKIQLIVPNDVTVYIRINVPSNTMGIIQIYPAEKVPVRQWLENSP